MPIILHGEQESPKKASKKQELNDDGSSPAENLLVRIGIGIMTGAVGFLITLYIGGRTLRRLPYLEVGSHHFGFGTILALGFLIAFTIGFVLGDNISEDWFENLFGWRNNW